MTGCTYCGTHGCEWETCPERLEDRHGVPSDYDDEGKLKTDGGSQYPECPVCETSESVVEAPEAGYWLCHGCGERGSGPADDPNWWCNDPDSIWYVEDDDREVRTDGGTCRDDTDHDYKRREVVAPVAIVGTQPRSRGRHCVIGSHGSKGACFPRSVQTSSNCDGRDRR